MTGEEVEGGEVVAWFVCKGALDNFGDFRFLNSFNLEKPSVSSC